jgi:hypothetical protein
MNAYWFYNGIEGTSEVFVSRTTSKAWNLLKQVISTPNMTEEDILMDLEEWYLCGIWWLNVIDSDKRLTEKNMVPLRYKHKDFKDI